MESSDDDQAPVMADDARLALSEAAAARSEVIGDLRLPAGYSALNGGGNAALIAGVAIGNSEWRFASVAFILGLLVQIVAATAAINRFKALNGAWVNGFGGPRATRIVLGVFVACLLALILVSTWLMVQEHPVISVLVALCAFPLTAASDRWWMARARHMA